MEKFIYVFWSSNWWPGTYVLQMVLIGPFDIIYISLEQVSKTLQRR